MGESIDMTEHAASFVWNDYLVLILMEEFFFFFFFLCECLSINTGAEIVNMLNKFLESHGLSLDNYADICTVCKGNGGENCWCHPLNQGSKPYE